MNPLNFLQHFFTLRAIKRELSDEKVRTKQLEAVMEAQRQKYEIELQSREAIIEQLRQENKELSSHLHAKPITVETHFDL